MKFTIQNQYILGLASWLHELNLSGRQSRVRSRFVATLSNRYQENEKFRQELIEKYGKKDKKGALIKTEDGKSYILEDKDKFVAELKDLLEEEYTVTLDGNDGAVLKSVVLDTDYVFGPKDSMTEEEKVAKMRQANDYAAWCEAFEKMV